jgi:biopolymer transport protein ExbB
MWYCGSRRRARDGFAALAVFLTAPSGRALAQGTAIATAELPRDLSPWGMYQSADPLVKGVLVALVLASVAT